MPSVKISLGLDELKTLNLWRAVFAEFFGTMLFLMCVTCVALSWTAAPDRSANNVEIGIGIGLSIATLAQAFGHVSGGHLNPAVSFGLALGGRVSIVKGLLYMIAQLIGGIAGSAITYGATSKDINRDSLGVNGLDPSVSPAQGFGLELMFTFILVFFVFSVTDEKKNTEPYGTTLGIGICIWVAHVCLIPFTGCGINPARSFGPAVVMNIWDDHWIYWVGPLLGAIAAAILYNFVFYVDDNDDGTNSYEANEKGIPLKSSPSSA